jgi:hypothetical protein
MFWEGNHAGGQPERPSLMGSFAKLSSNMNHKYEEGNDGWVWFYGRTGNVSGYCTAFRPA